MSKTTKAVVAPPTGLTSNQGMEPITIVNADGTPATIQKQAAQADSVAATLGALVTDFNSLLAKLRSAGILS